MFVYVEIYNLDAIDTSNLLPFNTSFLLQGSVNYIFRAFNLLICPSRKREGKTKTKPK